MNVIDDGTGDVDYECIQKSILDSNVVNMSLIIIEGNDGSIDAADSTCHGYYIIKFSSSLYTLKQT